jgi:chromosome segregation ATPase
MVKFDPAYILKKLYIYNKELGGNLLEDEANDRLMDPFFNITDEIKDLCGDIKERQNKRNEIKKTQGATLEVMQMTNQIGEELDRADGLVDKLNDELRAQEEVGDMKPETAEEKANTLTRFEDLIEALRTREDEAEKIKPPGDEWDEKLEKFEGFDNEGEENRADNRPLTDKEKQALERWKQEDEELDGVLGDIDAGMDDLLNGIDEMGENLKEQAQIIDKVEGQVDDLTAELSKTAKKLKETLKKWKSAPGAATTIVMILIL